MSIISLLILSSCTPDDATQTIGDIQAVEDNAGVTVSIVQSSPAADTQQRVAALAFAKAASRAAWLSASELNSKDSISQKNEKVTGYFSKVAFDQSANSNIKAGEEQLSGSIKLLLGRLESNRSDIAAHPGVGDAVPESIPRAITGRLNVIRQNAIDNIAAADALLNRLH